jgi:hypothetical protein
VGGDKSNFSRFTSRLSYDHKFLKKFKFTSSLLYTGIKRKGVLENAIGSVLYNALNNAPTFTIRDANGDFTLAEGLGNEVINPLAQIANTFNETRVKKINGNFGLNYKFNDNFEVESRIQANYAEVDGFGFSPIANYGSGKVFNIARSAVGESYNIFRDYTFDAFARYTNTFNDAHNVKLLLATSVVQETGYFSGKTGFDIVDNDVSNASIDQAMDVVNNFPNGGNRFDQRLLSYFTRLQYDYKGKYLFSGVFRRDGSTRFGPENKFGYFPSASVGWVASDEDFLAESNSIDFLKLRAFCY